MKLRTQLVLAFTTVGIGLVALAATSAVANYDLVHSIERTGFTHDQYRHLTELSLSTGAFLKEIADGLLFGENDALTADQVRACEEQFARSLVALEMVSAAEEAFVGEDEKRDEAEDLERVAELRDLLRQLGVVDQELVESVRQGQFKEALQRFKTEVEELYDVRIRSVLEAAVTDEDAELRETHLAALAKARQHRFAVIGCAAGTLVMSLVIGVALTRAVSRRVHHLVAGAERFGAGDLKYQIPEEGNDELTQVTKRFNLMAGELARQRAQLEMAHQHLLSAWEAGVAEVAGGVLHNIGNVLNSINVSVGVLRDSVCHEAAICDLRSILEHAGAGRDDWVRFLSTDERGAALPAYIAAATAQAAAEHQTLCAEVSTLTSQVEHVRKILDIQKAYAHASAVEHAVSIVGLIDDAIQMCGGIGGDSGIELCRDYEDVPQIAVDRHKALQIVLNLLRNAKQSVRTQAPESPHISVRVSATENGGVRVAVSDNGTGIAPDAMERVFEFGFTTKKHGQGIGLHNCRLAAEVLNASVTVESAGPAQGATFTLTLPAAPLASAV